MAYATLEQLTGYLTQLDGDGDKENVLQAVLDRAASAINLDLGIDTDLAPATAGTQVVYGDGTPYLVPAGPFTNVTSVEPPYGYGVPTYIVNGNAIIAGSHGYPYYDYPDAPWGIGWRYSVPYTVHATFGYSQQIMTALEQANLEIAVNLWRFKDSGGAQQVGAETGIINVRQQFSPMVRDILATVRKAIHGNNPGVW